MRDFQATFTGRTGAVIASRWFPARTDAEAAHAARNWLRNVGAHKGAVRFQIEEV